MAKKYIQEVKEPFLSAYGTGTKIPIPSMRDTVILWKDAFGTTYNFRNAKITVTDPNNNTVTITDRAGISGEYTFERNGQYAIRYIGEAYESTTPPTQTTPQPFTYTYYVSAVQNKYPLKKQTIKDVIERILRLCEPLVWDRNKGDYVKPPRFKFAYKYPENTADGKAERALFNQTSPEFTFTRCTLREALQMVGQFIHAEPRLLADMQTFIFDRYGEQDLATYERIMDGAVTPFNQHPYKGKHFSHDIGVACTQVESDLDNFVNRLDGVGGTITEPFRGGALTLRTDEAYGRFEDAEGSMYYPTSRGFMDGDKFYWVDLEGLAGTVNEKYDITPYLFEKTAYDAELSSYETQYPRSKAYALYYTQGERNIYGFFFKNEEWSGGVFANYAIVNILEQVTGKRLKSKLQNKYPTLAFELTYTPMYKARVSHGKSYIGDMLKKPYALMYNQSSNIVETRYYGEHLKGVAERLGNVDKQVDVIIRNVGNIPKIGQMWDDDYYIATVKGSAVYDGVLLSIGLSKKFNRLSAYVGANSYKRYYEVSERMAQDRKMLYKDYLVITNREGGIMSDECGFGASNSALCAVANTFYQVDFGYIQQIGGVSDYAALQSEIVNLVQSTGYAKNFTPNTSVYLPVTSSAFGNCMEFTWDFKDNYSVGVSSTYQTSTKTVNGKPTAVSGYFGAEVTYGDYYGRMYYQQWALGTKPYGQDVNLERALALPKAYKDVNKIDEFLGISIDSYTNLYHVVDKDSREILSQAYSIEFVTDIKGVVIGSALSRNNPMIGGRIIDNAGEPCYAELYVLPNRVNQFSNDEIDLSSATLIGRFIRPPTSINTGRSTPIKVISNYVAGTKGEHYLQFDGWTSPVAGKAWAIVTRRYQGESQTVENENGEIETITPTYGGELLIAQNIDIAEGDVVGKFNIVPTHDIYEFMKKEA